MNLVGSSAADDDGGTTGDGTFVVEGGGDKAKPDDPLAAKPPPPPAPRPPAPPRNSSTRTTTSAAAATASAAATGSSTSAVVASEATMTTALLLDQCRKTWRRYLRTVRSKQSLLLTIDDVVQRLLFFLPVGGGGAIDDEDDDAGNHQQQRRWTEVLFGLLQLNRLSIDLANQEADRDERKRRRGRAGQEEEEEENKYGTSVAATTTTTSSVDGVRGFPAVGVRIALTVLQCVWPVAQQLARVSSSSASPERHRYSTERRQARVRCVLERIRFALRMSLLLNYWKDVLGAQRRQQQQINESAGSNGEEEEPTSTTVPPGLLLDGGLFSEERRAPTLDQERARLERASYVGRRTGRTVYRSGAGQRSRRPCQQEPKRREEPPSPPSTATAHREVTVRTVISELLYVIRPLLQAEAQQRIDPRDATSLGKLWGFCLSLDLASLAALRPLVEPTQGQQASRGTAPTTTTANALTREEWNRRRWRLWLYLLRSPVWDRYTRGTAERVSAFLELFPLVGGLMQNYLWENLYYWKMYRSEEG